MKHLALALALLATPALAQDADPHAGHNHGPAPVAGDTEFATVEEATTIQGDDRIYGEADAPHELVVYASVTCGHCGAWFTEEWPAVKKLADAGKVRVALREFPTSPGQIAVAGFMLANCAPADAYFTHLEGQFAGQDAMRAAFAEGRGREAFAELAKKAGLDTEAEMQACFESDASYAPIERSMQRAEAAGLSGVPAFFLDGESTANVTAKSLEAALK